MVSDSVFSSGLVNLYTRDMAAGIHFYADLLGLAETFRTPTDGTPEHIEFRAGGFTLGLGTVEAAKRVHGVDATPGAAAAVVVLGPTTSIASTPASRAQASRPSRRLTTPGTTTATPSCATRTGISSSS